MVQLTDQQLELFVQYAVPEKERQSALGYIEKHRSSGVHMAIVREYYSSLPECREEPLCKAVIIDAKEGTYLLGVQSTNHQYFYCADQEQAVYLGEVEKGLQDEQALQFFGYSSSEDFGKKLKPLEEYPEFTSGGEGSSERCPVCSAKEGEEHALGCIVEICPWCDDEQLSRCNCRFEKLGTANIETEEQLIQLEELLKQKGRVPFKRGQGPSYPVAGDDKLEKK